MTIRDKAVLVTGASQGLGRALAKRLAARGARVGLVARNGDALEEVSRQIRSAGGRAHALVADLADKSATHALAATAAELLGPIDVLIHNASTLGATPLKLLLDTECEELERVLAVNLVGPFRLSRVIAGSMAVRGAGTIVHISSDAAVNAYPRWGAYSASKAGQDHLSRIWAEELAAFGVRVLAIDPGEMNTAMHAQALPDANPAGLADPDAVAERIVGMLEDPRLASGSRTEAQRWGAPS
jgi:NAD(P)-dependent dehydrogenase (short-subunit alcohol dehydrogenase family)